jgi:hypothetical protein
MHLLNGSRAGRPKWRSAVATSADAAARGSWPLFENGPGHLSVTVEAYTALRLMGAAENDPVLERARGFTSSAVGSSVRGCSPRSSRLLRRSADRGADVAPELMFVHAQHASIYDVELGVVRWCRCSLMASRPQTPQASRFVGSTATLRAGELYVSRPYTTFSLDNFFLVADRVPGLGPAAVILCRQAIQTACEWTIAGPRQLGRDPA